MFAVSIVSCIRIGFAMLRNYKPKISIVIPTYNNEKYVLDAVNSAINQSYKNIEVIVVDDGSTDETQYILKKFEDKIKYIYQKNKGVSAARNKGIMASTGKFICFLDGDDILEKNKIEKQLEFLKKNTRFSVSYTDMALFDESGVLCESYHKKNKMSCRSGFIFKDVVLGNIISTITVMAKREVFDNVGLFNESMKVGEDFEMWLRISSKYEIGYIPEVLSFYRRGHQSLTNRKKATDLKKPTIIFVIEEFFEKNPHLCSEVPVNLLRQRKFLLYFDSGWSHHRDGNFNVSKQYFLKALALWPLSGKAYAYLALCYFREIIQKFWKLFYKG